MRVLRGSAEANAARPSVEVGVALHPTLLKLYALLILLTLHHTTTPQPPSFLHIPPTSFRATRLREIEESFWHRLTPFDGQWYQDIAVRGYRELSDVESADRDLPSSNLAFFPLLPGVVWFARTIAPVYSLPLAILIVLWASVVGAVVAGRIAQELKVSPVLVIVLLAAFPTAFFQVMLYTEGPFLLLSGLTLYFTMKHRLPAAAVAGALASLCRPQGVLLAIPIFIEFVLPRLKDRTAEGRRSAAVGALAAAAPLCGFAVMAFVSYHVTGSPTAFLEIQSRWGRSFETGGLLDALAGMFDYSGPPFDLVGVVFGIALIPMLWLRLPASLAAYGTCSVLLPLLTGSILSMGRFMSVSIPHFLCLAMLLEKRPVARYVTIAAMVVVQVLIANGAMSWQFVG